MRRLPALLAAILVASTSLVHATTTLVVTHEGRLLDSNDAPLDATVSLTFSLHTTSGANALDPDSVLWTATHASVQVRDGYYAVEIGGAGSSATLPASQFSDGAARYLGVAVNGVEMLPRVLLGSLPRASFAAFADASGGVAWAGGVVQLDGSGKWPASALAIPSNLVSTDGSGRISTSVLPSSVPLVDGAGKLDPSVIPGGTAGGIDAVSLGGHTPTDAAGGDHKVVVLDASGKIPSAYVDGATFSAVDLGSVHLDAPTVTALLTPVLISPASGAALGTVTPTFTWGGAAPFVVEVAAAATPSTVVWTTTTSATSATVGTPLNASASYVWRVRSTVGSNNVPSESRPFTTGVPPLVVTGSLVADSVKTLVTASVAANATSVPVASVAGFGTGDMVVVIDLQGTVAGRYEIARVTSVGGSSLNLAAALQFAYPGTTDKVMVQKMIRGAGITVNGSVTASAWNGNVGGVVAMYAEGDLAVSASGSINVDGLGFRGGSWVGYSCPGSNIGTMSGQGESYQGLGTTSSSANVSGGGGGRDGCVTCTSAGAGGGHATGGTAGGTNSGTCASGGGASYGDALRTSAFFGSGGGGGNPLGSLGSVGGSGGGIVLLFATGRIDLAANVVSARGLGQTGTWAAGGGAGGTVLLVAPTVVAGAVRVNGFDPAQSGGGGVGASGRSKAFNQTP